MRLRLESKWIHRFFKHFLERDNTFLVNMLSDTVANPFRHFEGGGSLHHEATDSFLPEHEDTSRVLLRVL